MTDQKDLSPYLSTIIPGLKASLLDPVPEVRAAAIFALGTNIGSGPGTEATLEQANKLDSEIVNALIKDYDIVSLVRKELVVALYNYVNQFVIAQIQFNHNNNNNSSFNSSTLNLNEANGDNSSMSSMVASPTLLNHNQEASLNENASSTPSVEAGGRTGGGSGQLPKSMSTSVLNKSPVVVNKPSTNGNGGNNHQMPQRPPVASGSSFISGASNIASPILTSSTSMLSGMSRLSSLSNSLSTNSSGNKIKQQYQSPTTYNNLFSRVWFLLCDMQNDPCPDVAELATKVKKEINL